MMTRQAKWAKARIREGLCGTCGKRKLHGKRSCKPCKVRDTARSLKRYYALKQRRRVRDAARNEELVG